MIKLHCKNCGQKIRVPEIHAGKKGRCPKCKQIVLIPHIEPSGHFTAKEHTGEPKFSPEGSPFDPTFLDLPQAKTQSPPAEYDIHTETAEETLEQRLQEKIEQSEKAGKRKLPWLLDIFLYPTNKAGLTMIGIIIGVPLLFGLIAALIFVFTLVCPLLLITWPVLQIIGMIISILFAMYLYWYLCECVRDSALGGIRAPETLGAAPSVGEMFWRVLNIVVCCVIFAGPSGLYLIYAHKTDAIFWLLLIYAIIFFPMGLLAVIMFDSFSGLNPILLIRSIVSTFLPYIGLISLFAVLIISIKFIIPVLSLVGSFGNRARFIALSILYGSGIIDFYLLLVIAHLLGRFYWRYQDKLKWDV